MKHAYVAMVVMAIWGHGALLGGCDKEQPLPSCSEGTPCAEGECVEGYCQVCNPVGHAGCEAEAAVCRDEGSRGNTLYVCEMCDNDAECAANASAEVGDYCVEGRCVDCRPEREGVEQIGCGPDAPLCSVDGRCGPCDEATNAGCGGETAICAAGVCAECRPAREDVEQAGCGPDAPLCSADGRCGPCDEATNAGCGGETAICAAGVCAECRPARGVESQDGCQGARPFCNADNRCTCNPATNEGCAGAMPICDVESSGCRVCRLAESCSDGRQCIAGICDSEPATLLALLQGEPQFNLFEAVVDRAGLSEFLRVGHGINLFVPVGRVFGNSREWNDCQTFIFDDEVERLAVDYALVSGPPLTFETLRQIGGPGGDGVLPTNLDGHVIGVELDGDTPLVDGLPLRRAPIRTGNGNILVLETGMLVPREHEEFVGSPCIIEPR